MRIINVEKITHVFKEPAPYNQNILMFCQTIKITLEDKTQKIITLRESRLKDLKKIISELPNNNHYEYDKDREMLFFKPFL